MGAKTHLRVWWRQRKSDMISLGRERLELRSTYHISDKYNRRESRFLAKVQALSSPTDTSTGR